MQLPNEDEPLVLADGTKIDSSGRVIKDKPAAFVSIPNPAEAQRIVARTRRTVADLPVPPAQLSGVALVAFYTLFGMTDGDISIALDGRLTVPQITNIREQDAYKEFMVSAKENILHSDTVTVRDMFEEQAKNAARKIIELADSDNEVMALTASKDVLDRAGHRPADIVEHRHKMDDVLNIVVTKRDEANVLPVIDVTPERVDSE